MNTVSLWDMKPEYEVSGYNPWSTKKVWSTKETHLVYQLLDESDYWITVAKTIIRAGEGPDQLAARMEDQYLSPKGVRLIRSRIGEVRLSSVNFLEIARYVLSAAREDMSFGG